MDKWKTWKIVLFISMCVCLNVGGGKDHLTVGFIYDNDESTPYTYTELLPVHCPAYQDLCFSPMTSARSSKTLL